MTYEVLCGDVADILPTLAPGSFDAVLCDPPYGLSFMGKHWDHGVPSREVWEAVGRTLKPGAHLMAFGGTRTFHRLACAIEDAGFEIRDCLSWLYGQGFPKSLDISKTIDKAAGAEREVIGKGINFDAKERHRGREIASTLSSTVAAKGPYITAPATDAAKAWQGYGTALKPAYEPCILAMKPTDGTFVENALRHGVAGLNVDGGRIAGGKRSPGFAKPGTRREMLGTWNKETCGYDGIRRNCDPAEGRWPANVILDESAAAALDEQSGERRSAYPGRQDLADAYAGSPVPLNGVTSFGGAKAGTSRSDTGGASRFFYCAKSSRREREAGLDLYPERSKPSGGHGNEESDPVSIAMGSQRKARNHHPCCKPLALCEYLARLILPPKRDTPRRLLVPFSGSGSEMIGALLAGWDEVVGIEREPEYVAIAEARLKHWTGGRQLELSA